MNSNLQSMQFGTSDPGSSLPKALGTEPRPAAMPGDGPLPYTSATSTSAGVASAWRKPRGALSLTTATSGSLFTPLG